jgi:hypothetical protein
MFTLTILLIALNVYLVYTTKLPPNLIEVKKRYATLREHLRSVDTFPSLWREKPVTGFHRRGLTTNVGFNSNKGDNIAVCVDGDVNSIMHVLLHELAHCTVPEFDHSAQFWVNYRQLRDIASDVGVYSKIVNGSEFCGETIRDA